LRAFAGVALRNFRAKGDFSRPGLVALRQTGGMTKPNHAYPAIPSATDPTRLWPDYRPTPLVELPVLAHMANVGRVFAKLEGERPLGNFKALGGMTAGLRALARAAGIASPHDFGTPRVRRQALPRLICASDGNHGLSVAAAAARAGTRASIHLPIGVSRSRAERIEALGGDVVWTRGTYDDAVHAAAAAAERGEGLLIADTTDDPNDAVVKDVIAGYALLTRELVRQFRDEVRDRPGHLFVQAGVGGLAAAIADGLRDSVREPATLMIVEPASAACVTAALAAGHPVRVPGDLHTCATMLSCGLASAPAIEVLLRHAARSVVVGEDQLQDAVGVLREAGGPDTTPSGAAGLAGLLQVAAHAGLRARHGLGSRSTVLLVVTEGAVADRH
jgi:diaminopropionate ammonia-lyase